MGAAGVCEASGCVLSPSGGQPGDSCETPFLLEPTGIQHWCGNLGAAGNDSTPTASCSALGDGPDHVYHFELASPTVVTLQLSGAARGLVLRWNVCSSGPDFAYWDSASSTTRSACWTTAQSRQTVTLPAGSWSLAVEGDGTTQGDYDLWLRFGAPATSSCDAPLDLPNTEGTHHLMGSTLGGKDSTSPLCVASTASDDLYALHLDAPAEVALRVSGFDSTIALRDTCTPVPEDVSAAPCEGRCTGTCGTRTVVDAVCATGELCTGSCRGELACNDDSDEVGLGGSLLRASLQPGDYFFVVSGWGSNGGFYDLAVDVDTCPGDVKARPGLCGCGVLESDSDGDGVLDCLDGCPDDPLKSEPGQCGCGQPDFDGDGDQVVDCLDPCPEVRGTQCDAPTAAGNPVAQAGAGASLSGGAAAVTTNVTDTDEANARCSGSCGCQAAPARGARGLASLAICLSVLGLVSRRRLTALRSPITARGRRRVR